MVYCLLQFDDSHIEWSQDGSFTQTPIDILKADQTERRNVSTSYPLYSIRLKMHKYLSASLQRKVRIDIV